MIAYLSGLIRAKADRHLVLDVNGVGYKIFATAGLVEKTELSQPISLHIHTVVREEEISLYGFSSLEDKKLFLMLMQTQGVGPKTALAITEAEPREILGAIKNGDVSFFTAFPRVGKKVAQKIYFVSAFIGTNPNAFLQRDKSQFLEFSPKNITLHAF